MYVYNVLIILSPKIDIVKYLEVPLIFLRTASNLTKSDASTSYDEAEK